MRNVTNDLISREALLIEMAAGCMPLNEKGISGVTGDESTIADYIKNAPAVDAAPVVHGQRTYQTVWHTPGWGEIYTVYGCCGFRERGKTNHNYCPNCGAKMDGDGSV